MINTTEVNKTKSLCEQCGVFVNATIIEHGGKSYIEKECPECGKSTVKISNYSEYYSQLRNFYFKVAPLVFPQVRYLLFCTPNCNLQCPICFLRPYDNTNKAISVEEVKDILKRHKAELVLQGGDPTCADNIFELIAIIKSYQKDITLATNGLKLEDYDYALKLKNAGVNRIMLQFDGFNDDAYKFIRNSDIGKIKLKVLDNLKRVGMQVSLLVTVMKGINDDQVIKVINYAVKNDYIRAVIFQPYTVAVKENPFSQDRAMLRDDVIDIIERDTKKKINRQDIFLFQKLLYVFMSYLKMRVCLHSHQYVVIRNKEDYFPIGRLLNLPRLEKILDRYVKMKTEGVTISGVVYLLLNLPLCIFHPLFIKTVFKWLKSIFLRVIDKDYLMIQIEGNCSPPQMDYRVVNRCTTGWIFKDKSGRLIVKNNCSTLLRKVWKR